MKSTLQIAVESELTDYLNRTPTSMDFIMCSLVPRSKTQSNLYYQIGWEKPRANYEKPKNIHITQKPVDNVLAQQLVAFF